jgi:methylmalonyl-CoA mutase
LAAEFPAPSLEAWRALSEKALKGRSGAFTTYDGIEIAPLCTAADAPELLTARPEPGPDRGRPWDLRTVVEHPDPSAANAQALEDLKDGARSLLLRLDPTGEAGVAAVDHDSLQQLLAGVLLDVAPVAIEAGLYAPEIANYLSAAAKGAPNAELAFHMDPLSVLGRTGETPGPIGLHLETAADTAKRHYGAYPKATLFLASGQVVHEAGGSEAQELGFMAAAALAYAKAMAKEGIAVEEAFRRTVLGLAVDADCFASLAKLRAARAIFERLSGACGADARARIEARSSRRMLTRLDPWTNLLRLTAACFAGATGGADAIVLAPFTEALGRPTAFARRQARNIQLVLMEEAGLGRVADPAGGAWFVERLTADLARAGWAFFQEIEGRGGIVDALRAGFVADAVSAVRRRREADLAERRPPLIGVTEFVNPDPAAVAVEAIDPRPFARPVDARVPGPDTVCPPLPPMRLSAAFEAAA